MKILIVSTKGHWIHGWFSSQADLESGLIFLSESGLIVEHKELGYLEELKSLLEDLDGDTLLWPNAYNIDTRNGEKVWINEVLEAYNAKYIGASYSALQNVFKKDLCQAILKNAEVPIPKNLLFKRDVPANFQHLEDHLPFPLVLKPTTQSSSLGVSIVHDFETAKARVEELWAAFPESDVLAEEFLPNDDITCGYLQLGQEFLLLPTYYIVKSAPANETILHRKARLQIWDEVDKFQRVVTNSSIRKQLAIDLPIITKSVSIDGITRVDGRMDREGVLRFFDVNGLPAMCYPEGVMVKQAITCFPNYAQEEVFEALLNTIVLQAAKKYGLEVPKQLELRNLFSLDSEAVIRGEIKAAITANS